MTYVLPYCRGTNHNSDKIIVIAVLGKSAFTTKGSKIACIDHILPFDDKIHKNNEEVSYT